MHYVIRSETDFTKALEQPRNLLLIHRELSSGPGRRHREQSLNRGAVVFTVAAWQTLVEQLARAAIDGLEPDEHLLPPKGNQGRSQAYALHRSRKQAWKLHRATVLSRVSTFSTPNAENTRALLQLAGVDVKPYWSWRRGRWLLSYQDATARLNAWLRVRHALAHGDSELPSERVLSTTTGGRAALRLSDAEECVRFFGELAHQTVEAVFEPGEPVEV